MHNARCKFNGSVMTSCYFPMTRVCISYASFYRVASLLVCVFPRFQTTNKFNKIFIDVRLRAGIATPPWEDRVTAKGELHNKFREDRQRRRNGFECGVQFLTPKPFAHLWGQETQHCTVFTRMWLRYVGVFAVAIPSLCRLSTCNVGASYSVVEAFGKISSLLCMLAILWRPCKILRRLS